MDQHQRAVLQGLAELYPDAGPELHFSNPFETLVATILAAQCTDARVNLVTPALFRDYPDAAAMAQAEPTRSVVSFLTRAMKGFCSWPEAPR